VALAERLKAEKESEAYLKAQAGIADLVRDKFFGGLTDSEPEEWDKRFAGVANSGFSKDTRLELVKELLALRTIDVQDGEEAVKGSIIDRKVSAAEKEVRSELNAALAEHVATLRPQRLKDLFFNLEGAVRAEFDKYKGAPPAAEVEKLRAHLNNRISQAVTGQASSEIYTILAPAGGSAPALDFSSFLQASEASSEALEDGEEESEEQ